MRHRTRNTWKHFVDGIAYSQTTTDNRFVPPVISVAYPVGTAIGGGEKLNEEMEDLRGPKKNRKPCYHSKESIRFWECPTDIPFTSAVNSKIKHVFASQAYEGRLLDVLCGNQALNNFSGCSARTTDSDFLSPDWFALLSKFRDQVDNTVPRDFFLWEFLIEYKIFLDSFRLLLNPTRGIKSLVDLYFKLKRKPHTLGRMASISRSVASGYLGYNFGVKPAIGGVRSILNSFQRIEKRMQFLQERAGQWIPIRVKEVIPCSIEDNGWPSYDPNNVSYVRKTVSKAVVASVSGLAQVRDTTNNPLSVWGAYKSLFGISDVIQLAWELVPFSFVIDWFTNTQERIDSIFKSKDSPFVAIKDLTFTVKEEKIENAYVSPHFYRSSIQSYCDFTDWTLVGTRVSKLYDRTFQCPDTSGVIDVSHLGTFHGLTFGALLFQRLR